MENIEEIEKKFEDVIEAVDNLDKLEQVKLEYLGKKGVVTELLQGLKDIPGNLKRDMGIKINIFKKKAEQTLFDLQGKVEKMMAEKEAKSAKLYDITLPTGIKQGSLSPITIVQKEIEEVFKSMGFVIEDGNEIETEYNNFEAVNVPKNHPARDMQDTFWLENGQVLKTHTSASQNRILKKYGAPCKVIFPGRCFRNESIDASHDTTFFQLEGMMVGKDISIANLIYFMKEMLTKVFKQEVNVRLRPGYFPFVEPGFELDASCMFCGGKGCPTCKQGGWIELCPCGMIHPEVLRMGGINPDEYQGFAFGLGLTRLAMMKFNINEIRQLNSCNVKFLKGMKTR